MATWRWLGVNNAMAEEKLLAVADTRSFKIPAGTDKEAVVVFRQEQYGKIQVKLGENSRLKLTYVQLADTDKDYAGEIEIQLSDGAQLEMAAVEAGGKKAVSKVLVNLAGNSSRADVSVLYLGDKQRVLDMNYVMVQSGKKCEAKLEVYGALLDKAEKIFRGTLDFKRGAKGAAGQEKEQVVVLSSQVRNRSVPLMLSGESEVDGHHAVSIGKIDEAKLYYLMSRGLEMAEAKKLVVEAAFAPVMSRITDTELQGELQHYIKERLSDA